MKRFKKFTVLVTAIALLTSGLVYSFADEVTNENTTTDIIMDDGDVEDAEYNAYKLLDVTLENGAYKYVVTDNYREVLQTVTGQESDEDIISYIAGLEGSDVRVFADTVYEKVRNSSPDLNCADGTFEDVEKGYYLITENTAGSDPDSVSLVMLSTIATDGPIYVKTKEDIPTLEKKVIEENDSTNVVSDPQDAADYDIGDVVPFQLTGTLPTDYSEYGVYQYAFHDTLSDGLTYNNDVKVYLVNGEEKTDVTNVVKKDVAEGDSVTVEFWDMKSMAISNNWTINSDTKVVVEYTATLNENAVIGSEGNINTANLVFSNNPYTDWETGETPDDKVIVFTYETIVNKVDKDGNPLQGAGFTLYKFDFDANDYVAVSEEISGSDITTFEFTGLDAGLYKLVETTVPTGYNKADDMEFEISATYDTESADPQLIELSVPNNTNFTANTNEGTVSTQVENLAGTMLPETGGIGTTIFYCAGAIMLLVGVVLLVTKKRMDKETK